MNIKKIIAREGLIFLCVFLVVTAIAIWSNPTNGNITALGRISFPLVLGYVLYLMIRPLTIAKAVFSQNAKGQALREISILAMPIIFLSLSFLVVREFSANQYLIAESRSHQIVLGFVLTFAISVPFYMIRFIVWAIKTLRAR